MHDDVAQSLVAGDPSKAPAQLLAAMDRHECAAFKRERTLDLGERFPVATDTGFECQPREREETLLVICAQHRAMEPRKLPTPEPRARAGGPPWHERLGSGSWAL